MGSMHFVINVFTVSITMGGSVHYTKLFEISSLNIIVIELIVLVMHLVAKYYKNQTSDE